MSEAINFNDFTKVDLRIGTIVDVADFSEARNPSYKLKIDFGELGIKQSSAQITTLYKKDELLNRQVVAVVNFPTITLYTVFWLSWSICTNILSPYIFLNSAAFLNTFS